LVSASLPDASLPYARHIVISCECQQLYHTILESCSTDNAKGTSSIVDETTHEPLLSILSVIVETAVKLQQDGHKVILVSSGAIGVGLRRMDRPRRPDNLPEIQALAAIGQCRLMSLWDQLFGHLRQPVAQILLTRNDIADRQQYINAQNTFAQLLEMGVIPIVNENDTLAVTEIKFGDNDTLSAITAAMVHADYLFLMTDVDCLYDSNPRDNPNAKSIEIVRDIDKLEANVSGKGSEMGTGGMYTKIVAARRALSVGVTTIITRSSRPGSIKGIIDGLADPTKPLPLHTRFIPSERPMKDRNFWLLNIYTPHGNIYIDDKSYAALIGKAHLTPAGVVDVEGTFAQQEAVRIFVVKRKWSDKFSTPPRHNNSIANTSSLASPEPPRTPPIPPTTPSYERFSPAPEEVGRAVMNYSSDEIMRIRGVKGTQIGAVLGYADSEFVAFRENIALFKVEQSAPSTPPLGGEGPTHLFGGRLVLS
jgi:glutamate 5-kinase